MTETKINEIRKRNVAGVLSGGVVRFALLLILPLLIFSQSLSAYDFSPPYKSVQAWISGSYVYYRVYDPALGETVEDRRIGSSPSNLIVSDGVVSWKSGTLIYFAAYDPIQQRWISGYDSGGDINQIINNNGVVAWYYDDKYVRVAVFDLEDHRFYTRAFNAGYTNSYITDFHNSHGQVCWVIDDNVCVACYDYHAHYWDYFLYSPGNTQTVITSAVSRDGVVAWASNNSVRFTIYNPKRGTWTSDAQSFNGDQFYNIAINNATVTFTHDGRQYTWGYDHYSNRWRNSPTTPMADYYRPEYWEGFDNTYVYFNDLSIGATTCYWSFGDGTGSYSRSPLHVYTNVGTHEISQQVSSSMGSDTAGETLRTDFTGPAGSIIVNNGEPSTIDWNLNLTISATDDSGTVKNMRIGHRSGSFGAWEPYTALKVYDQISSNPGTYTIYIQFEDESGNISETYRDDIELLPRPRVTLTYPTTFETFYKNNDMLIKWNHENAQADTRMRIILKDGNNVVGTIVDNITITNGSYLWSAGQYIGGSAPPGQHYRLRLEIIGIGFSDESPMNFVIADPFVKVESPNTGSPTLYTGNTENITWSSGGLAESDRLRLVLLRNGATVGTIADYLPASQTSFAWNVGQHSGGTAPEGSNYQIRVQTVNGLYSDAGDTSFSIQNPSIAVQLPSNNETLYHGTLQSIWWNNNGIPTSERVRITLLQNSAFVGTIVADHSIATNFVWNVGQHSGGLAPAGPGYQVRVETLSGTYSDTSDGYFIIKEPSITVNAPNNGELWPIGSTQSITWDAEGIPGTFDITLYKDGQSAGLIASGLPSSTRSYSWTTGQTSSGSVPYGTGYSIRVSQQGTAIFDASNAPFTISGITITSPGAGETWIYGSQLPIYWDAAGTTQNFKMTLFKDGIVAGKIVTNLPPDTRSYTWTIGQMETGTVIAGSGYKLQIKEMTTLASYWIDNITIAGSLALTAPIQGDSWPIGSQQTISWTAAGFPETAQLKIPVYKDGAYAGHIAKYLPAASGSYTWTVGETMEGKLLPGDGYSLQIKEMGGPGNHRSDQVFSIPGIVISSPNGTETLEYGTTRQITWDSFGLTGNIDIVLLKDGAAVGNIAEGLDPSIKSFDWAVGQTTTGTVTGAGGYTIRVQEAAGTYSDDSDAAFTIKGSIHLEFPNNGETLPFGSTQVLTWTAQGLPQGALLKLTLIDNQGQDARMAINLDPGAGSYTWTVGQTLDGTFGSGTGYRIQLKEMDGPAADWCDTEFDISALAVTSPSTDQTWATGSTQTITWVTDGTVTDNVRITLWNADGKVGRIANNVDVSSGSYQWTVGTMDNGGPVTAGTGYYIRVTVIASDPAIADNCDGLITITE